MPSPNTASLIDAWNTVTFEQYNTLAGSHREAYQAGHRPGGIVRIDKNRVLIPQPLPPNVFGAPQPQNSIHFPHVNGTQGIPLQILMERGADGLRMLMKGAMDMPAPKARYIHLHILWPGMSTQFEYKKRIPAVVNGAPLTRAQIGHQVALAYFEFFRSLSTRGMSTKGLAWDVTHIGIHKLAVLSVCNIADEHWQAELAIMI